MVFQVEALNLARIIRGSFRGRFYLIPKVNISVFGIISGYWDKLQCLYHDFKKSDKLFEKEI